MTWREGEEDQEQVDEYVASDSAEGDHDIEDETKVFQTQADQQRQQSKKALKKELQRKTRSHEAQRPSKALKDQGAKSGQRGKLNLAKVFYQEFYDVEGQMNFPNYLSVAAKPSKYPPRFFCSVCGFWSKY